ncbi:MAG: NAAT family transporter [Parachlamydiales bacterium]|nr:NAAT family transporter [Parachlamydiales bacterium]
MKNILWIAFSLFLLMDALGNIPIYMSYLHKFSPKKQSVIIFREMVIALGIMIVFAFIGDGIMQFLHIGKDTIQIAGGIILFILALKMIFPVGKQLDTADISYEEDPFIVPLAVPLVAGPATLSAIMLYISQMDNNWTVLFAIILAWIPSLILLLGSSLLARLLGKKGLFACQRLMGLILVLIAVEMFLAGIRIFIGP